MNHISSEKLDLFLLNKALLGDEIKFIEKHLEECSDCKAELEELHLFYKGIKESDQFNTKYNEITKILEERHKKYDLTIETIFKKENNKPTIHSFINYVKNLIAFKSNPVLKWSLATVAAVIILFMVYLLFQNTSQKPTITEHNDTIHPNAPVIINKDTNIVKEENKDTVNIEKKGNIEQKPLFAYVSYINPISNIKGSGPAKFNFIKAVDIKKSSAVLFAYKPDRFDILLKQYQITEIISKNSEQFRILFPKTVLTKNNNSICKIKLGLNDIDIIVSENNQCSDNPLETIYNFDNDLKIKGVSFDTTFKSSFKELKGYNPDELGVNLTEYANFLKGLVKYWDGTKYSTSYKSNKEE